jgi:cysteinyl-tRNA synthetase
MGEDKVEQEAKLENKSALEITDFYLAAFKKDLVSLNILEPNIWCKATDHIPEQIALIKVLETKGYTYKTSDGIYFDTSKFPDYNKLSHLKLDELKEGARVEKNQEKKNPTDFALWKFSVKNVKRQMEWESPWGIGFPGWHIECSAMSLKYLSDKLDIHCGGVDHINIHHTNELAQSEAATGKPFFNYWIHGEHLNLGDGEKMGKSTGNILTLDSETTKKGIDTLAFRYLCFMTHWRKAMTYKEEALEQASAALINLRRAVANLGNDNGQIENNFKTQFTEAINDDLNMPQAIAILNNLIKADLDPAVKRATINEFDKVLALNLIADELPEEIKVLTQKRLEARNNKDWKLSDDLREQIEAKGFIVEDGQNGTIVRLR